MRFRKLRRDRRTSILDVTPLVDVVFLLQIFFLLTLGSPLVLSEVDLPATISGRSVVSDTATVIVLEDSLVVDGRKERDTRALGLLPRNRQVVVMASKDIVYARVMEVLDALRVTGHPRISLATMPVGK